jgi:hypothetical protein
MLDDKVTIKNLEMQFFFERTKRRKDKMTAYPNAQTAKLPTAFNPLPFSLEFWNLGDFFASLSPKYNGKPYD